MPAHRLQGMRGDAPHQPTDMGLAYAPAEGKAMREENRFMLVAGTTMLALAFLTRCTTAHAWDCSYWSQSSNPSAECYKPPGATQNATQGQGQQQSQGQGQTAQGGSGGMGGAGGSAAASSVAAGGAATNAGNSQSTTFTSPRQAVDGFSTGSNNTAACSLEQHAGIGSILGGFSIGRGKRDKDCARQILATQLWSRGQIDAGNRIYCDITEVKQALGDNCIALMNERTQAAENVVTHQELREVENRITEHMVGK